MKKGVTTGTKTIHKVPITTYRRIDTATASIIPGTDVDDPGEDEVSVVMLGITLGTSKHDAMLAAKSISWHNERTSPR